MRNTTKRDSSSEAYERRIRGLEDELYLTRRTIIELMPPHIKEKLCNYSTFNNAEDWRSSVVAFVVGLAQPIRSFGDEKRTWCPLCGSRGSSSDGYKLPEGLEHHLRGNFSARRCPVMAAAFRLAIERLEQS